MNQLLIYMLATAICLGLSACRKPPEVPVSTIAEVVTVPVEQVPSDPVLTAFEEEQNAKADALWYESWEDYLNLG